MQATLERYRAAITKGQISPHFHDDGHHNGLLLHGDDPRVPLLVLAFGVYRLSGEPLALETAEREYVFVAQRGTCEVAVEGTTWQLSRPGSVFAPEGGPSASSAVYLPRETRCVLRGTAELAFFSAPASARRPAVYVDTADHPWTRRGTGPWRRDVTTLVTPQEVSCNLTVGETYSPPGQWSGTPLHRHDRDDPTGGQSDHEEVYYFQFRDTAPPQAAFGVQLLFDDRGLDQSYRVGPGSVIALPGACHPVVAGPGCDLLYMWGLASTKEAPLRMWDVPDTAFLATVGALLDRLTGEEERPLTLQRVAALAKQAGLDAHGSVILTMLLRERGLLPA
jgi:5-deoxy-glucuronate isomerase